MQALTGSFLELAAETRSNVVLKLFLPLELETFAIDRLRRLEPGFASRRSFDGAAMDSI